MLVTLKIATAMICFMDTCYPALIGVDTLPGTYQLVLRRTVSEGYGGDVIKFRETEKIVYSIHRLWTLKPEQNREIRIKSSNVSDRVITNGCINVEPEVYEKIKDCCSNGTLVIE
jgi:hypothetical protein